MKRDFTTYFELVLKNYRATYQKYMGLADEEMPTDETLIISALNGDMHMMLEDANKPL